MQVSKRIVNQSADVISSWFAKLHCSHNIPIEADCLRKPDHYGAWKEKAWERVDRRQADEDGLANKGAVAFRQAVF